ncbi:MAG TPA: arylesterase [Thermohalobaculum sp.]|nr:arylesterase [Thermohalobaculum sp.]
MSLAPLRHPVPNGPPSYGPAAGPCNPLALALAVVLLVLLLAGPLRAEAPLRIVAIGDSLTAGYGLAQDEGFVPLLADWLAAHGAPPVELVNMGVSGDTTAGGRARLDWVLADGADAVILALGGNDLLRGIAPQETRANLDAMLAELTARGLPVLLIGIEAPHNYGAEYKAAFDAIHPELAARHGALLDCWCLGELADQPGMAQQDGLHPSAAGVARLVERLGPAVLELIERVPR